MDVIKSKACTSLLATLHEMEQGRMKINWELNIVFFFEVFYSPIQVLQVGGGIAAW